MGSTWSGVARALGAQPGLVPRRTGGTWSDVAHAQGRPELQDERTNAMAARFRSFPAAMASALEACCNGCDMYSSGAGKPAAPCWCSWPPAGLKADLARWDRRQAWAATSRTRCLRPSGIPRRKDAAAGQVPVVFRLRDAPLHTHVMLVKSWLALKTLTVEHPLRSAGCVARSRHGG